MGNAKKKYDKRGRPRKNPQFLKVRQKRYDKRGRPKESDKKPIRTRRKVQKAEAPKKFIPRKFFSLLYFFLKSKHAT